MLRRYKWMAVIPLLALSACSASRATTAEEFVQKLAKAHYFKDSKAVAQMTLCAEDLDKTSLPVPLQLEVREFKRDSLAESLKRDMKRDAMWSKAWEDTKYVSQEDHQSHIHVEVKVGYAYSDIVLVRVGKYLKIAPNPSSFE